MPPYVGMARKQNGGYNASISVQTLIFHLVVNSTRLKTVRSALWRCPNSTVALRLLENVVKVTNLEVVKIEFRHLPILSSFFFFSQPSALTRAVLKTKHPQIAVKFFEDVPFQLSFQRNSNINPALSRSRSVVRGGTTRAPQYTSTSN